VPAGQSKTPGPPERRDTQPAAITFTGPADSRVPTMAADPLELRRIDVDAETSIWLPLNASGDAEPPARAWRVRPAAVTLGAMLAAAALLRLGLNAQGALAAGLLAVVGVLAVIDLESRVLPNRILGPAAVGLVAFQTGFFPHRLAECVLAGLGGALLLTLPTLFRRGAMGGGDVKLAGVLGLALGGKVLVALTLGSLATVPAALVILLRRSSLREATIPFGPFLALGTVGAVLL
jgi:leader peptidase (prepilin peptidase) / N-methyltransferase